VRDIDWFEYERRKRVLRNQYPTSQEYDAGIKQIVAALEADADRAEIHEAKTTDARCPNCVGKLEPIAGYFDPNEQGVSDQSPRAYEEAWECVNCEGRFNDADVKVAA